MNIIRHQQFSLAACRVNAGKTQSDTAKYMRVSKQTVSNWENGTTTPDLRQSRKLADYYEIPLDYIFLPDESNNI